MFTFIQKSFRGDLGKTGEGITTMHLCLSVSFELETFESVRVPTKGYPSAIKK